MLKIEIKIAFNHTIKYLYKSYKQWLENNIPPQVIFEILSPNNTNKEMSRKLEFYQSYGVKEYYLYDLDRVILQGWLRQEDLFQAIYNINGWVSLYLGIRFQAALFESAAGGEPLPIGPWDRKPQPTAGSHKIWLHDHKCPLPTSSATSPAIFME